MGGTEKFNIVRDCTICACVRAIDHQRGGTTKKDSLTSRTRTELFRKLCFGTIVLKVSCLAHSFRHQPGTERRELCGVDLRASEHVVRDRREG